MSRVTKIVVGVTLVALAIGFIFGQASQVYLSAGRLSERIARAVYESTLVGGGSTRSASQIELILRKLAHFIEYLFLGTVIYAVARHWITNKLLIVMVVLLIALPIPFVDEFVIQAKTMGRSPQLFDVYIDLLAVGVSILVGMFYDLAFTWMHRGMD